jgi:hypothetical protein
MVVLLTIEGKCSPFRAFTSWLHELDVMLQSSHGNLAECSTESAPILEFLAQCSIKPEPPWLVPLRKPKMPVNEWKPVLRLFH